MTLKILIENENERVYTEPYGVPTIHLGDGNTVISDVITQDGFSGVCFSEAKEDLIVEDLNGGEDITYKIKGMSVVDIGAYIQILTKNPDSLDVLIEKLQLAKESLTNK